MTPTIIGLCGAANAGKNLVARLVQPDATIAFADPLYEALSVMLGIPVATLQDRVFKEQVIPWLGKSPRQMLQTLGTEWGRGMVNPGIWLILAQRRIEAAVASGAKSIAITDVRFDNEAELIRRLGGTVAQVVRPGAPTCVRHSSEGGISRHLIDATIENKGSIGDLHAAVQCLLILREAAGQNATLKDITEGDYRDRRVEGCAV
jgi:hypothetical protein